VLTAEGGPVEIGANWVTMENADIQGVPPYRVMTMADRPF